MSDEKDPARWKVAVGWLLALTPWLVLLISLPAMSAGIWAQLTINPPQPRPTPPRPVPFWVEPALWGGLAGTWAGPVLGALASTAWAALLARLHPERRPTALLVAGVGVLPLLFLGGLVVLVGWVTW